jgi:hypothetical protein
MTPLEKLKQTPVHTRQINVHTYACSHDSIIVEGELKDDRLQPYYRLSGEKCDPHTVHQLVIRMQVSGPNLRIVEIESEFRQFPRDECPETAASVQRLKGWKIAPGFTQKTRDALGGKAGCVHLTSLLLSMASAAVQGFWSYHARNPIKEPISPAIMDKFLMDTCWVWRQDGPLAQETKAHLTASENESPVS